MLRQKGNVLRRPSAGTGSQGSRGVSPSGTAEPNPTAPAGRIKPRINNAETGRLWLRTKQRVDRNTNGSCSSRPQLSFHWRGWVRSPGGVWYRDNMSGRSRSSSSSLKCLFSWKSAPGFHFPSKQKEKQKHISPQLETTPLPSQSFTTKLLLTRCCRVRSSLCAASSDWTFWGMPVISALLSWSSRKRWKVRVCVSGWMWHCRAEVLMRSSVDKCTDSRGCVNDSGGVELFSFWNQVQNSSNSTLILKMYGPKPGLITLLSTVKLIIRK